MVPLAVQDIDLAPCPGQPGLDLEPGGFPWKGFFFPGTGREELGLLHLAEWRGALPGLVLTQEEGGGAADAWGGSSSPLLTAGLSLPGWKLLQLPWLLVLQGLQMPLLQEEECRVSSGNGVS